jgi:hypothetical protein
VALPFAYTIRAADRVRQLVEDLDAHDVRHPERIQALTRMIDLATEARRHEIAAARTAGDSWTVIGAALGTSRQSAQQVYGG